MARLSGLAATGTWLDFHLHGLQVRKDGDRPTKDLAVWLPFDSIEAACSEPRIKNRQQWPMLQGPQNRDCPLPPAQPGPLPGLPSCQSLRIS